MEHYDEALIRRYLDAMRPDNLLLEVSSQKVDADKIEPWFQVPYKDEPLTIDLSGSSPAEFGLALPASTNSCRRTSRSKRTRSRRRRGSSRARRLRCGGRPTRASARRARRRTCRLDVAGGFLSPPDSAYANLYARWCSMRSIHSRIRPSKRVCSYDIDVTPTGFLITVSGYNDKQPLLLKHILDVFAHVDPSPAKVADYREELRRSWQNFVAERPYEQAMASLSHVMLAGGWPPAQLADALDDVTPVSLARVARIEASEITSTRSF